MSCISGLACVWDLVNVHRRPAKVNDNFSKYWCTFHWEKNLKIWSWLRDAKSELYFFYLTPKYLIRYERPGPVVTSYTRISPANVGPQAGARRSGTAVYASTGHTTQCKGFWNFFKNETDKLGVLETLSEHQFLISSGNFLSPRQARPPS